MPESDSNNGRWGKLGEVIFEIGSELVSCLLEALVNLLV